MEVSILVFLDSFATPGCEEKIDEELGFNPCFLRLLCNLSHGHGSLLLYSRRFNPCFLRLLCNEDLGRDLIDAIMQFKFQSLFS